MGHGLILVAGLVAAAVPAPAAADPPGTTERRMHVTAKHFGFESEKRIALRLDFDHRPLRLEQVQVGIHVIDPVRAIEGVRGRRFTGGLRVTLRPNGDRKWVAGRTYPLLVIFCPREREGQARAAKGRCTWIRTRVFLRKRF